MADETKKIILQLQIDQSKSLGEIVNLKDRISKLKEEQKALNLETEEGRKTFEAYNAQIKALTKEQKSLELAVEKTAAGFEFEAGSIAANRAELSKLTAEYKNLANPTAAQTKRIKDLSDRLKEQEAAIGNTSRNVGNYKDALVGIQSQLGVFGPQVQQLTVGFKGVTEGLKIASSGFTTLKGAIATTGIGILLLALASLISLFKNTDDGATKLEGAMGALGAITKEVTGFFAEIGDTLISIADGSESLEETLTGLGDFLINNLVNRLTSVLVAGDAVAKFFQGDWKGAAKTGLDAVIQFNTGIEGGTDKVTAYAKELAIVAEQAYQFAIQLDEVNDAQRELNVTNEKNDQIVKQLIKSSADKTKLDQDRIALLEKANSIDEVSFLNQQKIDKKRLELIQQRNLREQESLNSKLKRDLEEATSEEKKAKIKKDALQISDKLAQEEADLRQKAIRSETDFILLREKNLNRISALEQEIAADKQKAYEAYVKQLQEINQAELNLSNQRAAQVIANLDYEISKTKDSDAEKLVLMRLRLEKELELQKEIADEKLAQLTAQSLQENANQEQIALEKIAIEEQTKQNLLMIERKYQDDVTSVSAAAEKKRTEDIKKEEELRKKERDQQFNDLKNGINEIAEFALTVNEASLNTRILKNESARKKELASAGNDKAKMDAINKKYDKIEADARRKSAKDALDIQSIQAAAGAALAVVQALASSPPPASFVLAAIAGALGVAQVLKLQSEKSKLAKGGLLNGPSHANGGITGTGRFNNIEVEGGEFVVRKSAVTKETLPLLHYLNNMKINRPPIRAGKMATGGQIFDGGMSARQNFQDVQNNIIVKDMISQAIASQPSPIVLVKDINNGQGRRVRVTDRAKI
jgi:hypothetical protein